MLQCTMRFVNWLRRGMRAVHSLTALNPARHDLSEYLAMTSVQARQSPGLAITVASPAIGDTGTSTRETPIAASAGICLLYTSPSPRD